MGIIRYNHAKIRGIDAGGTFGGEYGNLSSSRTRCRPYRRGGHEQDLRSRVTSVNQSDW
ncbi:hypothetical protein [Shimazuella kribbensis]|uniref:hypothetical protein n=1 Tax=Shimazuella kribbensis TaxID=139808 RepID=UPI00040B18F3|nr:hypothetical protein [Shimazuella kribbensis]